MTRVAITAAAIALSTLITSASATDYMDDPRQLGVNEHLVKLCVSWQRVNNGLSVSRDQIFEAGLCQGYFVGVFSEVLKEQCDEYIHGGVPGWSLEAAVPVMMRIWRETASKERAFQITTPRHILSLVAEEMLGPKEGRNKKCRSLIGIDR